VSMLAPGLKDDFEAHATLELQHADRLAMRIQQLGGVPIYNPAEIATKAAEVGVHPEQGPTLTDMVIENESAKTWGELRHHRALQTTR
jgi:bacterioferritin (cytochrome b1)